MRAAGGVVLRRGPNGDLEVALVHRPDHADWSFPKGKLREGETEEEAALREVKEETGLSCRLGRRLGAIRYRDRNGRNKIVRYWTMAPVSGSFKPTSEIDAFEWAPVDEAARVLTYAHDRALLASALRG